MVETQAKITETGTGAEIGSDEAFSAIRSGLAMSLAHLSLYMCLFLVSIFFFF